MSRRLVWLYLSELAQRGDNSPNYFLGLWRVTDYLDLTILMDWNYEELNK